MRYIYVMHMLEIMSEIPQMVDFMQLCTSFYYSLELCVLISNIDSFALLYTIKISMDVTLVTRKNV